MLPARIIFLLVIIETVLTENSPFAIKLVNNTNSAKATRLDRSSRFEEIDLIVPERDHLCKTKCSNASLERPNEAGQVRFIDYAPHSSSKDNEVAPPAGKFSFINLLGGAEEEEEEEEDSDKDVGNYDYGAVDVEEEEEDDDDEEKDDVGALSFFDDDEEEAEVSSNNKLPDNEDEGLLKQHHRHRLRMRNLIFPLLLAYKLKLFTVVPMLLGSLVLLVGTTGVAGFFFALFAAALGLQVKSHDH